MKAKLKKNRCKFALTSGKEYIVIGLSYRYYRVIDDHGEPILYRKSLFDVTDETIPDDWIWEKLSDDEYYADPPETMAPGFYERYFDGDPEAVATFRKFLERIGLTPEGQKKDK